MAKKIIAELIGTFWLVFCGCGSAVLAATFPQSGIGFLGVAFAFGLTVLTMAYAFGNTSGGHFNPAVTVGLWAAGKFDTRQVFPYILSQVMGAFIASIALYAIASGRAEFSLASGFATNGYGAHSPGGYSLYSGLIAEIILTAGFLLVIVAVTSQRSLQALAPLAIGLTLTLIHLVLIPVTNASVNPARSTGPALIAGGIALQQLWLFWLAPLVGGLIGGWTGRALIEEEQKGTTVGPIGRRETTEEEPRRVGNF